MDNDDRIFRHKCCKLNNVKFLVVEIYYMYCNILSLSDEFLYSLWMFYVLVLILSLLLLLGFMLTIRISILVRFEGLCLDLCILILLEVSELIELIGCIKRREDRLRCNYAEMRDRLWQNSREWHQSKEVYGSIRMF